MARDQIIDKLSSAVNEDIVNECQVVYILSRIRKVLEVDKKSGLYKYLKFYCDWALHVKIDRVTNVNVSEILEKFITGDDVQFLSFGYFKSDLQKFFLECGINSEKLFEHENWDRFLNLLVGIYSDTPIEVPGQVKIITLKKPPEYITVKSLFSVSYEVKDKNSVSDLTNVDAVN